MKLFTRIKTFFKNVFSGGYDHATKSMNEFLATGKFPDKCAKPEQTEQISKNKIVVPVEVVKTDIDLLTDEKVKIIDVVATERGIDEVEIK